MSEVIRPLCGWTGIGENEEQVLTCERRATAMILDRHGHRVFTCPEHVASAKARAESGDLVVGLTHRPNNAEIPRAPLRVVLA